MQYCAKDIYTGITSYPGLPMFFNVAHEKGEGLVDYDEKCAFF